MAIKDAEEADLWPVDVDIALVLGFQDVEDDGNPVLVVVSDDALVGVGGVGLDDSALLLACFRGLMVLQLNRFWVQCCRVFSEQQSLHFDELDVRVLGVFA